MSWSERNAGKHWDSNSKKELRQLVKENTPTRVIAFKAGRTEDAIRNQVGKMGLSLKPNNQSPYNRKPK